MKTTPPTDTALTKLQQAYDQQQAMLQHIQHLERCILELKAKLYDLNTPYGQTNPGRTDPLAELIAEQKFIMESRAKLKDIQDMAPADLLPDMDNRQVPDPMLNVYNTDKVRLQSLRHRLAAHDLEVAVDSCANGDARYYLKPLTGRAAMVSDDKLPSFIKRVLHQLQEGNCNKYLKSDQAIVELITQALEGYDLRLTDLNSGLAIVSEQGVLMSSPTPATLLPRLLKQLASGVYQSCRAETPTVGPFDTAVKLEAWRRRLAAHDLVICTTELGLGYLAYYLKPVNSPTAIVSANRLDTFIINVSHELREGHLNKYLKSQDALVADINTALSGYSLTLISLPTGPALRHSADGHVLQAVNHAVLLQELLRELGSGAYKQYKKA